MSAHNPTTTRRNPTKERFCSGAVPTGGPAWVAEADVGPLAPVDRASHYLAVCERAGVAPEERWLRLARVGGRVVLLAVEGAAEKIAARQGLTLDITEGPRAVELGGRSLAYAVCRATHPDGRVETSTATVAWEHTPDALARCTERARRRATWSLLGLAVLDEGELDSIPSALRRVGGHAAASP